MATDADREWCASLMASTDPWKSLGRNLEDCRERCGRPGYDLVVARHQEERCGFALLHPVGVAGSPYIASIATAPEFRGKGAGSALLRHCEGFYRDARHLF